MSDPFLTMQRQIQALQDQLEQLRKTDVAPLYLPWTQRILNPFPLASSGAAFGDQVQPWSVNILAFYCSVYVVTTNNGTNFWTIKLIAADGVTQLASITTAAIAANTATRFAVTGASITQPATTNQFISVTATATLSPGAIFIVPAVALLRTGN